MPCMRAALRVLCVLVAALGGWAGVISLWPMRGASDAVAKAHACGASGCPRPAVDTRLRRRVAMAAAEGRVLRAGLDTPAGTLARRSGASVWVQFVAMVFCTHVRCLLLPLSLTAFGAARLAGEGGRGGVRVGHAASLLLPPRPGSRGHPGHAVAASASRVRLF